MSPEMLEKVRKDCLPEFNQKNSANAPALIITAFEKTRSGFTREGVAENEVGEGWGCYDLGLQNENLVLKAKDMGLDTLIMGIRNSEKLREYLEIPASQEVVSVIAVGYGAIKPEMPVRKNVEDIVKGLGTSIDYAVFANKFTQQTHMEGNIAGIVERNRLWT